MTAPGEIVEAFCARNGIACRKIEDEVWALQLKGERKLTIGVTIAFRADRVLFESFFMRRPQENLDRFYDLLLRRNMRAFGVHFALDATGDVFLVGHRGVAGLDDAELDRVIGAILTEADGLFDAAIEIGFESYLRADLSWRARGSEAPS